jgi:two-component system chemotaxis response regulator CheY
MFPLDSKILIVDDSTFARGHLKNGLKELKYWNTLEAADMKGALKIMLEYEHQANPIHLLFTDLHMPDHSGLEFLRWIRAQDKLKLLPVIVLTSSQEKKEILEAGKLGVSHYMIKPFDTHILREKITSTWSKHGEKYFETVKR